MWVKNPNSHKYDAENCSKIFNAFLDIDAYSSFIEIPKASKESSLCLINKRSVDIVACSSSYVNTKPNSLEVS